MLMVSPLGEALSPMAPLSSSTTYSVMKSACEFNILRQESDLMICIKLDLESDHPRNSAGRFGLRNLPMPATNESTAPKLQTRDQSVTETLRRLLEYFRCL